MAKNTAPTALTVSIEDEFIYFGSPTDQQKTTNMYPAAYETDTWRTRVTSASGAHVDDTSNHVGDVAAIKFTITMGGITQGLDSAARYTISLAPHSGISSSQYGVFKYGFGATANDALDDLTHSVAASNTLKDDVAQNAAEQSWVLIVFIDGVNLTNQTGYELAKTVLFDVTFSLNA